MRDKQRAARAFAKAFAEHNFHESEEVFLALWRDECRCMVQTALDERIKCQREIARQEKSSEER